MQSHYQKYKQEEEPKEKFYYLPNHTLLLISKCIYFHFQFICINELLFFNKMDSYCTNYSAIYYNLSNPEFIFFK